MADYGIKISKEGFDVETAGGDELTMSSSLNMFKVFDTGTDTISASSSLTIAHDLGYIPNYFVYVEAINIAGSPVSGSRQLVTANEQYVYTSVYADTADIVITDTSGNDRDVLYYIMHDPVE